jgi:MFS family permease
MSFLLRHHAYAYITLVCVLFSWNIHVWPLQILDDLFHIPEAITSFWTPFSLLSSSLSILIFLGASDSLGRKKMFHLAWLCFALGEAGCALSTDYSSLLFFHILTQFGAGSLTTLAVVMVKDQSNSNAFHSFFIKNTLVGILFPYVCKFLISFLSQNCFSSFSQLLQLRFLLLSSFLLIGLMGLFLFRITPETLSDENRITEITSGFSVMGKLFSGKYEKGLAFSLFAVLPSVAKSLWDCFFPFASFKNMPSNFWVSGCLLGLGLCLSQSMKSFLFSAGSNQSMADEENEKKATETSSPSHRPSPVFFWLYTGAWLNAAFVIASIGCLIFSGYRSYFLPLLPYLTISNFGILIIQVIGQKKAIDYMPKIGSGFTNGSLAVLQNLVFFLFFGCMSPFYFSSSYKQTITFACLLGVWSFVSVIVLFVFFYRLRYKNLNQQA